MLVLIHIKKNLYFHQLNHLSTSPTGEEAVDVGKAQVYSEVCLGQQD